VERGIIMADITGIIMEAMVAVGMEDITVVVVGTVALPGMVAEFTSLRAASMGLRLTAVEFM